MTVRVAHNVRKSCPLNASVLALSVAAVLGVAALAGCGSDNEKTVTETKTETTGATTGTATGANTGTATTDTNTSSQAETNPTPGTVVHEESFQTPSKNIACAIGAGRARCDIKDRTWSPGPRPSGCSTETDFGQGLDVQTTGEGEVVCAGDTTLNPGAPVLQYGQDSQTGGFTCFSRQAGMTCRNAGGHGFFLNRDSYRLF